MRGKDQSRTWFRRVGAPRQTLVAAGALLAGQDELDAAVHAAATGDTLKRAAFGVKDRGLAGRVELELDALGVGPRGRNVEGDAEPMAAGRVGELHIRGERVRQRSASLGPRGPEPEAFGSGLEGLADRILERHLIEREYRSGFLPSSSGESTREVAPFHGRGSSSTRAECACRRCGAQRGHCGCWGSCRLRSCRVDLLRTMVLKTLAV